MAVVNKLGANVLLVWLVVVGRWSSTEIVAADAPLPDCTSVLITLQSCLSFVTGKAATPSGDCCSDVTDIHYTNPACLCVLGQDDNTTRIIPNYRLDLAGQLPTLCKIQGASASECPALLGETNATSTVLGPVASAPTLQYRGGAHRLVISGNIRAFIFTDLGFILAASSLIGYIKY